MRVWAALTGLVLAGLYFIELYIGVKVSPTLSMLIAGIGGFEMFLFAQDIWLSWRDQNG
jgi:hypothetical protein